MSHIQLQMTSNHILGANVFMWVDSRFYGVWKSSRWFTMAPWLRSSVHIPKMLMESCIIFDANLMAICICYTCRWNGRCWWNIVPNDFHDFIVISKQLHLDWSKAFPSCLGNFLQWFICTRLGIEFPQTFGRFGSKHVDSLSLSLFHNIECFNLYIYIRICKSMFT